MTIIIFILITILSCQLAFANEIKKDRKVKSLYSYKNGKLSGVTIAYHENGTMKGKMCFKDFDKQERCTFWNPQGVITTDCTYKDGKAYAGFKFGVDWDNETTSNRIISTYKAGKKVKVEPCDAFGNKVDYIKKHYAKLPTDIKEEPNTQYLYGLVTVGRVKDDSVAINFYNKLKPQKGAIVRIYRNDQFIDKVKIRSAMGDMFFCESIEGGTNRPIYTGDKAVVVLEPIKKVPPASPLISQWHSGEKPQDRHKTVLKCATAVCKGDSLTITIPFDQTAWGRKVHLKEGRFKKDKYPVGFYYKENGKIVKHYYMDEIPYLIEHSNKAPLTAEQLLDTFSMNMKDDKGSTWNCGSKIELKNGSL